MSCLRPLRLYIFLRFYLFLEREEGREKERKRNINVREKHQSVAVVCILTRDRTRNPGNFPDRESNRQPFTLQDNTQPTELHQSGLFPTFRGRSIKEEIGRGILAREGLCHMGGQMSPARTPGTSGQGGSPLSCSVWSLISSHTSLPRLPS